MASESIAWSDPALELRGLRKAFGEHEVLNGVDLSVRSGEVMGVVGRNGVGKSTLAAILSGALEPDEGELALGDEPLDCGRVMIIEQELNLDLDQTVAETIFRHADPQRFGSPAELEAAARSVLFSNGLAILPGDRVGELTDSERRMIEVVRLVADPRDVIVVDEVSATLNAREVEELRYSLRRATEAGSSVVYITHRLHEALALCDRVSVMRDGEVVDVFSTMTATADDLSQAMFGRLVTEGERSSHVRPELALSVREMEVGQQPLSFDVRAGEVVALLGPRGSGVEETVKAITGEEPLPVRGISLGDETARITCQRDAVALGVAVLAGTADPVSEEHFARNMMMLNGEQGDDFDGEVENTAKILLSIRSSEQLFSQLLNRPALSMGQRRWRELRELAAQHARLMVLIEPSQGLDLEAREHFLQLVDGVTERGVAVILVSSDESEVHKLSDRILILRDGVVIDQVTPAEASVEDLARVSKGEWAPAHH